MVSASWNWIISETTSPVDYRPQIAALTTARAASQDAPSSLAIHCRAHRTELIISTTGSWKQVPDGDVKVVHRINEEPSVEQRWRAAETGKSLAFPGDVVRFLRSMPDGGRILVKVYAGKGPNMKVRFNWPAWIPSDVRSRRRATGPSPDRRTYYRTTFPQAGWIAMKEVINVAEAYDKGRTLFMGIELLVAPGALIPRAETELLGASAVDALRQLNMPAPRVIDMCCGAGNLACAISLKIPDARVWASDLTNGCVDVARRNVAYHGLTDRMSVLQGDLFDAFSGLRLDGTIDLIVCNPPYISETRLRGDRAALLELEPREAFAAGAYGLSIHMRVTRDALRYLRPGGILLFEVGLGQERQVTTLLERSKAYENIRVVMNETGEGRVVMGYAKA